MTTHRALADRIAKDAAGLAERSLERMYVDPFWQARFGDRGRRYAAEDASHHVTYLADALRAGDVSHLVGYARWLQTVLTTRGMCSAHLADHFLRLRDELRTSLGDEGAPAEVMLETAAAALAHDGSADALERASSQLADAWAAGDVARSHGVREADARRDAHYVASYLADAIALERVEPFVAHVRWLARQSGRAGRPARYVAGLLEHLAQEESAARTCSDALDALGVTV